MSAQSEPDLGFLVLTPPPSWRSGSWRRKPCGHAPHDSRSHRPRSLLRLGPRFSVARWSRQTPILVIFYTETSSSSVS